MKCLVAAIGAGVIIQKQKRMKRLTPQKMSKRKKRKKKKKTQQSSAGIYLSLFYYMNHII